MKPSLPHVASRLASIQSEGLYRALQYGQARGSRISIDGHDFVNLSSNNYLSIDSTATLTSHGTGSRLVSGNDIAYRSLEDALANHQYSESALVFPTGYMAVLGCITALAVSGYTLLSDELNHASIIDACRLAGADTMVFEHNDMVDLESKIKRLRNRAIIVTEGIFGMDGDYAPLKQMTEMSSKYEAPLIVDDAHGDFVIGDGHGCAYAAGVEHDVYATVSSLSKALGSFGGYVSSGADVRDLLVNTSRHFIYTSALPPALVLDAQTRLESNLESRRRALRQNVRHMVAGLDQLGLCDADKDHIVPVMLYSERRAVRFSESLARHGVYARAIRYPTVARNMARIRVTITAALSRDDIETALRAFEAALKEEGDQYP